MKIHNYINILHMITVGEPWESLFQYNLHVHSHTLDHVEFITTILMPLNIRNMKKPNIQIRCVYVEIIF
jgi:hypothetical protein